MRMDYNLAWPSSFQFEFLYIIHNTLGRAGINVGGDIAHRNAKPFDGIGFRVPIPSADPRSHFKDGAQTIISLTYWIPKQIEW